MERLTLKCAMIMIDQLNLEDNKALKQSIYDELYHVSYEPHDDSDYQECVIVKADDERQAIMKVIEISIYTPIMLNSDFYRNSTYYLLRRIGISKCIICKVFVEYCDVIHMNEHTIEEKYDALGDKFYCKRIRVFE